MKFAVALIQASIWSTASALALRGAAERAELYSLYLAEEVFTDSSKWTIARTCKGRRKGFRGQTERCDLLEFLDHVWMETQGVITGDNKQPVLDADGKPMRGPDTRPDVEAMRKQMSAKSLEVGNSDLNKMTQAIFALKSKPPGPSVAGGYTGFLNAGNVLDGYTDYFKVMGDCGANLNAASTEIDNLTDEKLKKKLSKWVGEAKVGAEYVYELRIKEDAEYKLKPPPAEPPVKSLSDLFGHPVETKKHTYPPSFYDGTKLKYSLVVYDEPDKGKTLDKWQDYGFSDRAAADTAYEKALVDYYAQDGGLHKSAIDSASKNKATMGCT